MRVCLDKVKSDLFDAIIRMSYVAAVHERASDESYIYRKYFQYVSAM
jgi:hypothetical protein